MPQPSQDEVQHQKHNDQHPSQFHDAQFVTLAGHAGHSPHGAAHRGAHVAEDFVGVVQGALRAGIVVDVEGDVFQLRGFRGQRGQEGVVLSARPLE